MRKINKLHLVTLVTRCASLVYLGVYLPTSINARNLFTLVPDSEVIETSSCIWRRCHCLWLKTSPRSFPLITRLVVISWSKPVKHNEFITLLTCIQREADIAKIFIVIPSYLRKLSRVRVRWRGRGCITSNEKSFIPGTLDRKLSKEHIWLYVTVSLFPSSVTQIFRSWVWNFFFSTVLRTSLAC